MTKGKLLSGKEFAFYIAIILPLIAGDLMFQRQPMDQLVKQNSIASFNCTVNGSRDSIEITWERNGMIYTKHNTTYSDGISKLTLSRVTVADSGKYRCRATNVDGGSAISNEAELISE